jgi:hypothetical protein
MATETPDDILLPAGYITLLNNLLFVNYVLTVSLLGPYQVDNLNSQMMNFLR